MRRSSILLQPYPKVCVCVHVCVAGVFVHVWHLCVLGCKNKCVSVCVCVESGGKVKKHDLWKGVVLESSRYSDACKS